MVQRWHDLLFAHWRCDLADLRPLIPAALEIDTCDGSPWISVIPFYMSGVRMRGTPPLPTAHAFAELNVRTYVTLDGRPGIWFFSLDAASSLAVIGARIGISLPYFRATMRLSRHDGAIRYESRRWSIAGAPASFHGEYLGLGSPASPAPGSVDHFLTERYSLYSSDGKRLWRGDIYHPRWLLEPAEARIEVNSMIAAAGLGAPNGAPLLQDAALQEAQFWWPVRVR
jgi:uncharacterized protein YqjF (DUF2071 family)